jgi:hypothetical protein
MPDITAATREKALPPPPTAPRSRTRRFGAVAFGLLAAVGLGLAGGLSMHRLVDLEQTSRWLQHSQNALQSSFELARTAVTSRIECWTGAPTSMAQASQTAGSEKPNSGEAVEQAVSDLSKRVEQARSASESLAQNLGQGLERIRSSAEENHRELVGKLASLGERLERLERQSSEASAKLAQPVVQPSTLPTVKPLVVKPAPRPAPEAKVTPKPKAAEKKQDTEPQQIANWRVRDVFDGTAVYEGPRGIVEVAPGEVIPGVGRVEAIVRSGRGWAVATSKGLIRAN